MGTVPKGFRFLVARPLDVGFDSLKGFKNHELKKAENKFQQCRLAWRGRVKLISRSGNVSFDATFTSILCLLHKTGKTMDCIEAVVGGKTKHAIR